jgi:hypothetical protein
MRYFVFSFVVMMASLIASCGGGIDLGLSPDDETAPEISVSGVSDGAAYGTWEAGSDVLNISAVAADASGIANTSIRINDTLVASENDSTAGYTWDVTGYDDGSYAIEVQAYDSHGNLASTSVEVTVNNDLDILPLPGVFPEFPDLLDVLPFDPLWP